VRIISFNANGIRSAARKGFFAWMLAESPDFVCVQETKAQEHQLPGEAVLAGYSAVYLDAVKKGYSGVAIYARTAPRAVARGLGPDLLDDEARFLRFDYADLTICSLYVPSGTSGPARQEVKYGFLDRLFIELERMRSEGRPIVICGDYNIAHLDIDVFNVRACAATTGFLPPERAWFDRVTDELGWVVSRRQWGAQAIHVVVGMAQRLRKQSRLAHRLSADHARAARARAIGPHLQRGALFGSRPRDHRLFGVSFVGTRAWIASETKMSTCGGVAGSFA
jgi:exodeoxyribonuclease-3